MMIVDFITTFNLNDYTSLAHCRGRHGYGHGHDDRLESEARLAPCCAAATVTVTVTVAPPAWRRDSELVGSMNF